jgi:hypothetical protein
MKQSIGGRDDRPFARTRQHGIPLFHIFLPLPPFCGNLARFPAKTAELAARSAAGATTSAQKNGNSP